MHEDSVTYRVVIADVGVTGILYWFMLAHIKRIPKRD